MVTLACVRIGAATLACAASLACAADASRPNLFNMASGAVVVARSEYNESSYSSFNLFDDDPKSLWCSPQGRTRGNAIVIELSQRHRLDAIAFDNTGVQEARYPGVSARTVEVWVSTTGADAGMRKVAAFEVPKGGRKEFPLPDGTLAEWVRLVVADNWGHAEYTELADVSAFGTPIGEARRPRAVTGTYRTNYGALALVQRGDRVTGCYYGGDGQVSGVSDGRVLNLEWRQNNGRRSGVVVMVLTTGGEALNGLWYEGGALQGTWSGSRDPSGAGACRLAEGGLAADLKQSGRAIAYGIHFKSDSDVLDAGSEAVLNEIVALMKASPALHLRVEGHTDATNTEAYNLDLSRRRARSVVRWLTEHGVSADRLASEGYGKARPVADNATPQGRALNRRVELGTQP